MDGLLVGEPNSTVEYVMPSGLVSFLKSIRASIDAVDIVVSSVDFAVVDRKSVRLDSLGGVDHGADGALLYRGVPIKGVFENFYLMGSLDLAGKKQLLKPHYCFAKAVKSVTCGDWRIGVYGGLGRDVLDYHIVPDRSDWRQRVVDRTKELVAAVADASGVSPFLMSERLDLVVTESEMPRFLDGVRLPEDIDSDYPMLIR